MRCRRHDRHAGLMWFADAIRTTYLPFPYSLCEFTRTVHPARPLNSTLAVQSLALIFPYSAWRDEISVRVVRSRQNRTRLKPISDECSRTRTSRFRSKPERERLIASHRNRLTCVLRPPPPAAGCPPGRPHSGLSTEVAGASRI